MVDIEQRALRALEQDALALPVGLVEQVPRHVHVRQNFRRDFGQLRDQRRLADFRLTETAPDRIVMHENAIDLRFERVEIVQILHADRAASDLVFIGRSDPATRRSDLARAGGGFAQLVEFAVQRQDQRRVLGNAQVLGGDHDLLRGQLVDFSEQRPWIDDDAIADDRELARAHDTGR